jgi:hypothetical protein
MKNQDIGLQLSKFAPERDPSPETFPESLNWQSVEFDLFLCAEFRNAPFSTGKKHEIIFLQGVLEVSDHRGGSTPRPIFMDKMADPFELPLFFAIVK